MASDESVLEDLNERYDYNKNQWADIRSEGGIDMRYVAGDPWEPGDRKLREVAHRPCVNTDEISQYINQTINDIRQNPRAIQATALGAGANDQTAEFRANYIRQLEYRSKAQQAYTTMFENTVQRSYGFMRLKARYKTNPVVSGGDGSGFSQELVIEPFVNPDLVLPDFDALRPDGSDMKDCFVAEQWKIKDFKKRFGKDAEIKDFSPDLMGAHPNWIDGDNLMLAEYWRVETTRKKLLLFQTPTGAVEVFAKDLDVEAFKHFAQAEPIKDRIVEAPTVMKYLTNGVEILEREKWCPEGPRTFMRADGTPVTLMLRAATSIPIVCCFGKVLYLDDGTGPKRQMLSMVRLARDPQMMLAFLATSEMEQIGLSTKNPYMAYRGQVNAAELGLIQQSMHEPVALLTYGATSESTGAQILPPMQRNSFEPTVQALEAVRESTRRALQAAMGINPLPTEAQRRNQKSGVALERMESASQKGSFHFVDHYEEAITRMGSLINEALPHYLDTTGAVTVRQANGDTTDIRVNDPDDPKAIIVGLGEHDITLSTGPSFNSEREAASDFADTLLQIQDPQIRNLMLPLIIKLKNLGPIGDEMSDLLKFLQPPEVQQLEAQGIDVPPQVKAQLQQMGQQLQAIQGEYQKAQQIIQSKQIEGETALQKATLDNANSKAIADANNAAKILVARIAALANLTTAGAKIDAENTRSFVDAAERGIAGDLKLHMQHISDAADQMHARAMQTADHTHAVTTAVLEHQHALEEAQQAADLAPPPPEPSAPVDNSPGGA